MIKKAHSICAFLAAVCISAVCFAENKAFDFPPNSKGCLTALAVSGDFRYFQTQDNMSCVTMTQYDGDWFLIANYIAGMHMVNVHTGESKRIEPEYLDTCEVVLNQGGKKAFHREAIWCPTGVYFDCRTKLLYIANYTGHNLLIGRITDKGTFAAEKMIVAEGLTSPENVAVNEDGSRIAVADYDGNSIFLFDEDGRLLWKKDVPLAHGVEISDSSVYATSLSTREIIQFDLDGNEIRRVGRQANSGTDGYMWPTSLELHKGQMVVTDPHTGRLTILDDKLNYKTALGANGPYATNFNYPYAAIVVDDRIYVADTFANRILEMDMEGNLLAQISQAPPRMQPAGSVLYVPSYPYDTGYLYEAQKEVPPSFFSDRYGSDMEVVAGYSSFWLMGGNEKIQIPLMMYSSDAILEQFFWGNYFYNMWSHKVVTGEHTYYVFGSPQSNICLFYCLDVDFGGIAWLGQLNTFYIHGAIIGDQERWDSMLQQMDNLTDTFAAKVSAGRTRHDAYIGAFTEVWYRNAQMTEMESWLEFQCSQTESGKLLYTTIKQGAFTPEDWQRYVADCEREPNTHTIFERLLFYTFTGIAKQ